MRWIDICGSPGTGKSTIVDPLFPPRCIEWRREEPLPEWGSFLDCVERLLKRVEHHPSAAACQSMMQRTIRKMSAVAQRDDDRVYIQTGFAQRGLGIGWRLNDPEEISEFYELMPVSVGVAFLSADVGTICRRNVERGKDRSYMVPFMERPRAIAIEVLRARGVAILELDTTEPVDENRARLVRFAREPASAAAA